MQGLRDFLNWFSGMSENIKSRPSPEQWSRINAELLKLKAEVDATPVAHTMAPPPAPAPGAPDPVPGGTRTTEFWKSQVFKALVGDDIGMDEESARETMGGKTFFVDLNMDPMAAARQMANAQ